VEVWQNRTKYGRSPHRPLLSHVIKAEEGSVFYLINGMLKKARFPKKESGFGGG